MGGASSYIDATLFGAAHVYSSPTCSDIYQCGAHDPEGFLGGMMAGWMAWLGLWAGRVFVSQKSLAAGRGFRYLAGKLAVRWVPMGLLLCLTAGILCGCELRPGTYLRPSPLPPFNISPTPSFFNTLEPPQHNFHNAHAHSLPLRL